MAVKELDQNVPDDELEDDDLEEGGGKRKKRMSGKKIVLFIALPILLVVGGLSTGYFFGAFDSFLGESMDGEEEEEVARGDAFFFDIPDLLVNLNSTGSRSHYLKVSISLELPDPSDVSQIESVMPRIIDNFQVYLRELRIEDLRGSAGITRLREQLLKRINVAAAPARVSDVLFREMLVQ